MANVYHQRNEGGPKWTDYAQVITGVISFLLALLIFLGH